MIAVAAYCVLALTVALAGLGITACILVGPGRDTNRGLRWLWRRATRDMPAPADTQAIQDPPVTYTPPPARPRIYLTPAAQNKRAADLDRQLGDLPTWDQLAALYMIPEETS
jgi:hypothetical protein